MRYTLLALLLALSVAQAADTPYIDPAHLDCPWPKHSYYKIPWRGYLETKPAIDFLNGIGVAYHSPGNDELAIRLLAETGFRAIRIEVGWGNVNYDESGFNNEEKLRKLMALVKQYNLRPTMLLNAHEGVPCPLQFFQRKLAEVDSSLNVWPMGARALDFRGGWNLLGGLEDGDGDRQVVSRAFLF